MSGGANACPYYNSVGAPINAVQIDNTTTVQDTSALLASGGGTLTDSPLGIASVWLNGNALNGGGQNQARCMLTGALVGAQVGLQAIPKRFLDPLENGSDLMLLARRLGEQAEVPSQSSTPAAFSP